MKRILAAAVLPDPHEMHNIFETSKKRTELMEMIRSRPDDAIPRLPQVGMA